MASLGRLEGLSRGTSWVISSRSISRGIIVVVGRDRGDMVGGVNMGNRGVVMEEGGGDGWMVGVGRAILGWSAWQDADRTG